MVKDVKCSLQTVSSQNLEKFREIQKKPEFWKMERVRALCDMNASEWFKYQQVKEDQCEIVESVLKNIENSLFNKGIIKCHFSNYASRETRIPSGVSDKSYDLKIC